MNQLRKWMRAATPQEREQLAALADTTMGTLHQISGAYRSGGKPSVRAGLARRLELAAEQLRKTNRNLPVLVRTDLSPECAECEFAQKCLGQKAVASDFPFIVEGDPGVGHSDSEGGEE